MPVLKLEKIEQRMVATPAKIEVREDGEIGSITGYAAVFNKDSENMGFVEQIAPGAFKGALKRSTVRGLKNHDPNLIFAKQGVNLELVEDKVGLRYVASSIDTPNFRSVAAEVGSGMLDGQSFGFTVEEDSWEDLDSDLPKRTIRKIGEVFDVGPVTFPAYPDTSVALRSLEHAKKELRLSTNGSGDDDLTIDGDETMDRITSTLKRYEK